MYEVIGNLKNKIILNERIILDLKNYIYNKYPGYSSKELSLILADGIHRIISSNMAALQEFPQGDIEGKLIRDAVANNDFSISAYKLFCQYCRLNFDNEVNVNAVHKWLSLNQDKPVSKDELVDFINKVKVNVKLPIEDAINIAAEAVLKRGTSAYTDKLEYNPPQINLSYLENNIDIIENETIRRHKMMEFVTGLMQGIGNVLKTYSRKGVLITAFLVIMLVITLNIKQIGNAFINSLSEFRNESSPEALVQDAAVEKTEMDNGLPKELQYIEIDKEMLRKWLDSKNSLLAEEPYLSSILETARQYNINPLFLIAITGQEQGFVPKYQENALRIANNPFNVYGSWADYNTTINDSSEIAAQTIINLSKGRPEGVHAIQWINQKYAEDKNWWIGVEKIFTRLNQEIVRLDI